LNRFDSLLQKLEHLKRWKLKWHDHLTGRFLIEIDVEMLERPATVDENVPPILMIEIYHDFEGDESSEKIWVADVKIGRISGPWSKRLNPKNLKSSRLNPI